ncbi:uncharacterized protein TEOVI_000838500 [Trypanosoma equiperdum]|uniref:Secreted protein n=2 Tax=Trypanozoon TaxID=39700 RepID=Q4GYN5_TRYB2|nr:hypothetical protein, unlikely [Trypanosoma brucei brucei TREU927]CAJ16549.1 hypothetical protein, unlikely [Trypanosoma brucei brucei TREU927]SCU67463.1 hypothetical protein, conserved [Trypanosoma equiperdum]
MQWKGWKGNNKTELMVGVVILRLLSALSHGTRARTGTCTCTCTKHTPKAQVSDLRVKTKTRADSTDVKQKKQVVSIKHKARQTAQIFFHMYNVILSYIFHDEYLTTGVTQMFLSCIRIPTFSTVPTSMHS